MKTRECRQCGRLEAALQAAREPAWEAPATEEGPGEPKEEQKASTDSEPSTSERAWSSEAVNMSGVRSREVWMDSTDDITEEEACPERKRRVFDIDQAYRVLLTGQEHYHEIEQV